MKGSGCSSMTSSECEKVAAGSSAATGTSATAGSSSATGASATAGSSTADASGSATGCSTTSLDEVISNCATAGSGSASNHFDAAHETRRPRVASWENDTVGSNPMLHAECLLSQIATLRPQWHGAGKAVQICCVIRFCNPHGSGISIFPNAFMRRVHFLLSFDADQC